MINLALGVCGVVLFVGLLLFLLIVSDDVIQPEEILDEKALENYHRLIGWHGDHML